MWIQEFDGLLIVLTHGVYKLVGLLVQPASIQRSNVNLQTQRFDQINQSDVFCTAEGQRNTPRFE